MSSLYIIQYDKNNIFIYFLFSARIYMTKKQNIIEIAPSMLGFENKLENFNKDVGSGKHAFLFLFMDGCEPCNETKPKWKTLQRTFNNKHPNNVDVVIAAINQKLFDKLNGVGSEPMGYPTLRYIKGPTIEEYEDSSISNKDRSAESFIEWVESKVKKQKGGRKTKRRGGKWSLKYKKSINCKRPKGFSQRQHCKYGRKTMRRKA
jgi:hypothetical protein